MCIEYDGIQHIKPVSVFGGEDGFKSIKIRDEIKNLFCCVNKIKLIRIPHFLSELEIINTLKDNILN